MVGRPAKKGERPGGRKKGTPNKATVDVRDAVALLARNLGPDLEGWIRRGAKRQPLRAAQIAGQIFEFHIPKLARTEHAVDPNAKTAALVMVQFAEVPKS